MASTNQEAIEQDWKSRGFSCGLWVDPPGQCWESFAHSTDELVIVLEGEMEFEINGEVTHPETGEELFIPAGAIQFVILAIQQRAGFMVITKPPVA